MSDKTRHNWAGPEHLADGHRMFRTHFDRFALADNSGRVPEDTDDGVLWLDRERPLTIEHNVFENKEYMFIPLIQDDGNQITTITTAATLLYLSARFGWVIQNEVGTRYIVRTRG